MVIVRLNKQTVIKHLPGPFFDTWLPTCSATDTVETPILPA